MFEFKPTGMMDAMDTQANIYIVEDDATLAEGLSNLLRLQGYNPTSCSNFANAANEALEQAPDLVVLDLKLPGTSGHAICRTIRERSSVPIVVLTSSDVEFDEVMALQLGANDYVTKPYRPAVLLARINAILRRSNAKSNLIEHAGVTLDLTSGTVATQERSVELTRNEQRILAMLMENPGAIVTRHELLCELWESDAFVDDNTLTVNVNRVRRKLASIGVPESFLETKRGQGYAIQ